MQLISALFSQPSRRRLVAARFSLALAAAVVGAASFASASKDHEEGWDSDHGQAHHCQRRRDDQHLKQNDHGSGKLSELRGTVDTGWGGKHPTDVTIAPAGNLAVVANHPGKHLAVVADQSNFPGDIVLINLTTRQEILPRLPVGEEPFGVAIDEDRGIAVVVNRLDGTLNVINLKPSTPAVLSLTVNAPVLPTEVAVVPGIPNALRVLTTDVGSDNVGVVEVGSSVLP